MKNRIDRRAFLAALGLGSGSLFLPSLLGRKPVRAGAMTPPKRLVIFYTMHGQVTDNWKMRRPGLGENAAWEFPLDDADPMSFSEVLRPLHPHRDKLLVLDGLSMASCLGDIILNEHQKGQAHSLTSATVTRVGDGDCVAGGPSFDQLVADAIARPDRLRSLELAVGWTGDRSVVYRRAGERAPVEDSPRAAFDRLFPAGSGAMVDPAQVTRRSVLDGVQREFDALLPRLGSEDAQKLQLHRDTVRDLERRLDALSGVACDRPATPGNPGDQGTAAGHRASISAFNRIITSALACDLTRVVSIQMGTLSNDLCDAPPGDMHADFAHRVATDAQAKEVMTRYGVVHANELAELIGLLAQVPEGSGTLLDNTLIVWCGEVATGNHELDQWPVVLAGGASGAMRTGRYLRWPQQTPNPHQGLPSWGGGPFVGVPNSKLFVSICRAMGIDTNQVGDASTVTVDGVRVDLTGPLDRLA